MTPGSGTASLVLLPGLDGTAIFFRPLLRSLPAWIHPVVVEYPTSGPNGYEDLIGIVEERVAALDRCIVLGWSFGGPLALIVANRRPDRVAAVVLCSSFVTPPRSDLVRLRPFINGPVYAVVRAIRRVRLLIPGGSTAEFRRAKAETWQRVGSGVLAARSRAVLALDARESLRACRAPVMYLSASHDEIVGPASRDEVVSLAPHTVLAEVRGRHFALFTNPADSVAALAGFLREGARP